MYLLRRQVDVNARNFEESDDNTDLVVAAASVAQRRVATRLQQGIGSVLSNLFSKCHRQDLHTLWQFTLTLFWMRLFTIATSPW